MGRDLETRRSWDDTEVGRLTHRTGRGRAVVEEEVTDSREDGKEEAEEEGEEEEEEEEEERLRSR